jgi:hypothetical protein
MKQGDYKVEDRGREIVFIEAVSETGEGEAYTIIV